MTLDHIPVSPGFLACPKRPNSSSDPLQSRWPTARRIFSARSSPSTNSCEFVKFVLTLPKSLPSHSGLLYLQAQNFSGTECCLFRCNPLISHFSPQNAPSRVPCCSACLPRRSLRAKVGPTKILSTSTIEFSFPVRLQNTHRYEFSSS